MDAINSDAYAWAIHFYQSQHANLFRILFWQSKKLIKCRFSLLVNTFSSNFKFLTILFNSWFNELKSGFKLIIWSGKKTLSAIEKANAWFRIDLKRNKKRVSFGTGKRVTLTVRLYRSVGEEDPAQCYNSITQPCQCHANVQMSTSLTHLFSRTSSSVLAVFCCSLFSVLSSSPFHVGHP